MQRIGSLIAAGLVIAGLVLAGCTPTSSGGESEPAITVEEQDNGLSKLTLSERAAQRLGVRVAELQDRAEGKVIPYGAVIYDAQGSAWAYAALDTLTFQRAAIEIESIEGEEAILSDGPPAGTPVVMVGAAELYGAETGVDGGH